MRVIHSASEAWLRFIFYFFYIKGLLQRNYFIEMINISTNLRHSENRKFTITNYI